MAQLDIRVDHRAPGDDYFKRQEATIEQTMAPTVIAAHPLDAEPARDELRKLLEWFYFEKDRQAENRMQMSMDGDFYDSIQWDPEDAADLADRGQMPLVFNEVAPMVDWLIGTERRTRVDWSVMPRTEDDVDMAATKTKVMKYVSDINRSQFARSRAFADTVKCGLGWVDDGVRDDPTQDILYSKYEDWRNVLHDSSGYELDLSDGRYVFRWRWVDEDIAVMMFPDRAACIREAVEEATNVSSIDAFEEEGAWHSALDRENSRAGGTVQARGMGMGSIAIDAKRRRVRLIECQYRKPTPSKVIMDGPLQGTVFDQRDSAMGQVVGRTSSQIIDKVLMRQHVAVFTETHMLSMGPSIYRHNKPSLTPMWCYRRGRDRQPYGAIRRVRDVQQDLNKRASKALFILNTNQIIADSNATDDWELMREEAGRSDGIIIKKPNTEVTIHRDTDAATGQLQMMTMDAQSIQKSGGVTQENLGRPTNAVSGRAIEARQLQGSVVTTEPYDNLRYATQVQGEKQLSLTEQFYTREKVIRLTGTKGALEWVHINVPEVQPDGSVRFINDMTASMADFVVSEQDYAGTLRHVMFEGLNKLAERLPPDLALRILTIAIDFSDLPNKDEIADEIRMMTGARDPNKKLTPEEQKQEKEQRQRQAEALEMQRQSAINALQEQQAKTRELNARASKFEAEAAAAGGVAGADAQNSVMQVRQQAMQEIDRVSEELRKAQAEISNRTVQINKDADTKIEQARIDADAKIQVAEIVARSDERLAAMQRRLDAAIAAMEARTEAKTAVDTAKIATAKAE